MDPHPYVKLIPSKGGLSHLTSQRPEKGNGATRSTLTLWRLQNEWFSMHANLGVTLNFNRFFVCCCSPSVPLNTKVLSPHIAKCCVWSMFIYIYVEVTFPLEPRPCITDLLNLISLPTWLISFLLSPLFFFLRSVTHSHNVQILWHVR